MHVDRNENGDLLLTDEQLEALVAKRNRKELGRIAELEPQIVELQAEIEAAREPLDNLRSQVEVESGKLASMDAEIEDLAATEAEYHATKAQADSFRARYEANEKHRALTAAATRHGAIDAELLGSILGELVVDDGKVVTADGMSIDDAVAAMRADPQRFGSLFKAEMKPGIGQSTHPAPGSPFAPSPERAKRLSTEQYMERRKRDGRKGVLGF